MQNKNDQEGCGMCGYRDTCASKWKSKVPYKKEPACYRVSESIQDPAQKQLAAEIIDQVQSNLKEAENCEARNTKRFVVFMLAITVINIISVILAAIL